MRPFVLTLAICLCATTVFAQDRPATLPGTEPLTIDKPLDVFMIEGLDRFCLKEIEKAREQRESLWKRDFSSLEAYEKSIAPYREKFRTIIGAVDPRLPAKGLEFLSTTVDDALVATAADGSYSVYSVRWPVLDGVTAEGLFLKPKAPAVARVIALPDADWTPEMIVGLAPGVDPASHFAAHLAAFGCEVLVPTLISRDDTFSGNAEIGRFTNQPHREWVYRSAFEMGRHVIGYEVQKVMAAVDQFTLRNETDGKKLPITVMGVSEGGLLALYSAAIDTRIDGAVVSGYFGPREGVWQEPIYRNVWGLLKEFGDAEIASMIAPRKLVSDAKVQIPVVDGPPKTREGRGGAAPGRITQLDQIAVKKEFDKVFEHVQNPLVVKNNRGFFSAVTLTINDSENRSLQPPFNYELIGLAVAVLGIEIREEDKIRPSNLGPDARKNFSPQDRQQRQVRELTEFTQKLLRNSFKTRDKLFAQADRSSVEKYVETADKLRDHVYRELIGKLPEPTMAMNPRSRKVLDEKEYTGYEVVLDVYPDVIAAGILLLPTDLKPGEKRPVVVCQHGLEGVPMDTISGPPADGYKYYKSFAAELAKRGFITYAPQNPYRGRDAFRTLQRKSNPLGRSLFSYIIPQHQVTLNWLATLPNVDRDRIAFYGLSYGGKTAMRVPPFLVPGRKPEVVASASAASSSTLNPQPSTINLPGYCLSICSADYNEWVSKNASIDAPFSYVFTNEYEIFEWNMGHVANYAELSMLMTPRPFMVERGHDDGVGIDEWVAWEYAKVRRHYNKLGLGDKTEIEFFNGPHTINGQGTFEFLHRHLNWPKR
jgi:dienelactone hydrolase